MNKTTSSYEPGDLRLEAQKEREAFFDAFYKETDRGLAIVSVCFLDNMLEKLIRTVYRQDPRIKILFKDNQVLQSFYNKVCIAYFSGLVPEAFYDDLKLIGEIRNKFAHSVLDTVSFDDVSITQKIDRFKQLPPDYKNIYPPKLKFLLITIHMGTFIQGLRYGRLALGPIKIDGMCNTDLATLRGCILTPQVIEKLMKREPDKQ
jgi:DNA-binding MltR family transcriptional regulator